MHLSTETALDWIENRVSGDQYEFWTAHLRQCDSCEQQAGEWQRMRDRLAGRTLVSAPASVLTRAAAFFQKPESAWRAAVRAVAAVLVFDSFAVPAPVGARGSTTARQIVLEAGDVDVHIQVDIDKDRRRLSGQVLPRGSGGFFPFVKIHVLRSEKRIDSTETDAFGEFQLADVPAGPISLQIDLPHITVVSALDL